MVDAIHSICFRKSLMTGREMDMPATEDTSFDEGGEQGKLQVAANKRNVIVMANFTITFTTDGMVMLVYEAMDGSWPSGLAHNVQIFSLTDYNLFSQINTKTGNP